MRNYWFLVFIICSCTTKFSTRKYETEFDYNTKQGCKVHCVFYFVEYPYNTPNQEVTEYTRKQFQKIKDKLPIDKYCGFEIYFLEENGSTKRINTDDLGDFYDDVDIWKTTILESKWRGFGKFDSYKEPLKN